MNEDIALDQEESQEELRHQTNLEKLEERRAILVARINQIDAAISALKDHPELDKLFDTIRAARY